MSKLLRGIAILFFTMLIVVALMLFGYPIFLMFWLS